MDDGEQGKVAAVAASVALAAAMRTLSMGRVVPSAAMYSEHLLMRMSGVPWWRQMDGWVMARGRHEK